MLYVALNSIWESQISLLISLPMFKPWSMTLLPLLEKGLELLLVVLACELWWGLWFMAYMHLNRLQILGGLTKGCILWWHVFSGVIKLLLSSQPQLAYIKDKNGFTPVQTAVLENNLELVKIFLEFDLNLAYIKNEQTEHSLFIMAAREGFVSIALEIMNYSPDSVYTPCKDGYSALHHAIVCGNQDFINYILSTPRLHRFVNQATDQGSINCIKLLISACRSSFGRSYPIKDLIIPLLILATKMHLI